ncbi:MAG: hypothetical protein R3352_05115, partial [Salinisphaeraceae bacterium]|nr:hypothetical protein [Salinisphaeraceae bacterium]
MPQFLKVGILSLLIMLASACNNSNDDDSGAPDSNVGDGISFNDGNGNGNGNGDGDGDGEAQSNVRVGAAVVDMTPDVGYTAGQYTDAGGNFDSLSGGDMDPFVTNKGKTISYGVQSRLTARAMVIEGSNGKRIALVKTDNYLAQDLLMRRVGQILDANGSSGVSYADILHHVT